MSSPTTLTPASSHPQSGHGHCAASDAARMRQLDHEAFATLVLALLITALFWLGLTLYAGSPHDLLGLPLWFVFSCLGGYLLSVVGVAVLVKKYFADMSLDEPEEPDKPGDKAPPAV